MPITEKGVSPFGEREGVSEKLMTWLQQLQMRFPKVSTWEVSLNPSNIGATSELDETYTVQGLNTQDIVIVTPPALDAGIGIMYTRVSATDTLQIRWRNFTGGGINPASGTYRILAVRV